jgi:hypothetical protein
VWEELYNVRFRGLPMLKKRATAGAIRTIADGNCVLILEQCPAAFVAEVKLGMVPGFLLVSGREEVSVGTGGHTRMKGTLLS